MTLVAKRSVKFYAVLAQQAKPEGNHLVFRGRPTFVFTEHVDKFPAYTPVKNMLVDLGFVQVDERGGGRKSQAVWLLLSQPTEEIIQKRLEQQGFRVPKVSSSRKLTEQVAKNTQDIADIKHALITLQEYINRLMELEDPEPHEGWSDGVNDTGTGKPLPKV